MAEFTDRDCHYMSIAIDQARKGIYTTSPNPNVGCVIVKNDQILATGFHLKAGDGHAEVNALAKLEDQDIKGSTVYVTLEPCAHVGKTGSCARALARAQVAKVVCAMRDPNPLVSGGGFAILEEAGIDVVCGLMNEQAVSLNQGFIKRMESKKPWVNIKLAMSLDARTAMRSGESQWITGATARSDVQRLRAESCAIITGIGSLEQDDSSLMVRENELNLDEAVFDLSLIRDKQPLRVVLDSCNKLKSDAKIINQPGRTLRVIAIPITTDMPKDVISLPNSNGQIDLPALLTYLAEVEQCNNVLVEAGATLAGSFVEEQLFDQLTLYMAPTILGSDARPLLAIDKKTMSQQQRLRLTDTKTVGDDIRLTYKPTTSVG